MLLRTRQSISNKIMSAILNFNPLKRANSPMTPKAKVQIKSMERTTRALLMNMYRRYAYISNRIGVLGWLIGYLETRMDHSQAV